MVTVLRVVGEQQFAIRAQLQRLLIGGHGGQIELSAGHHLRGGCVARMLWQPAREQVLSASIQHW